MVVRGWERQTRMACPYGFAIVRWTCFGSVGSQTTAVKSSAFGIAGSTAKKLFLSHPPLEERIAALKAASSTVA